jgi:hypothetical protein
VEMWNEIYEEWWAWETNDDLLSNEFVFDRHFHCVVGLRYRMMSLKFRIHMISHAKMKGYQCGGLKYWHQFDNS